jgi:hypothetical protein
MLRIRKTNGFDLFFVQIKCLIPIVTFLLLFLSVLLFISQYDFQNANAQCLFNLSGKWKGDDGGTYFIGQNGFPGMDVTPKVWWFGSNSLGDKAGFSNVFQGEMKGGDPSGKWIITGKWADVPMGNTNGNGELVLVVETYTNYDENGKNPVTYDVLTKSSERGGFGGTELTRPQPHCGDVNTSDTPEK